MQESNFVRIGILTHNYPLTSQDRRDAGIFVYDFAHELAKKANVFILTPDFAGKKENYKRVPVKWFNWSGRKNKLGNLSPLDPFSLFHFTSLLRNGYKAAVRFTKSNKIDFCLACWALPSGLFAREIKKQVGIPYAVWSLGSDLNQYVKLPILRQMITKTLRGADICFANSDLLCSKTEELSDKECIFLPAVTKFNLNGVSSKMVKPGRFNFLFVGRLEKVKGPDILLEACALLAKKRKDFIVRVLGDGTMFDHLRREASKLGVIDYFALLGGASGKEVASYMLASDCLVISSRNESLPLVLIEAARTGLPIISTDVGDCPRLVRDYNIGFIAKKGNVEQLARMMERAIRMGGGFKKYRREGLIKIAEEFSPTIAVSKFLRVIKVVAKDAQ